MNTSKPGNTLLSVGAAMLLCLMTLNTAHSAETRSSQYEASRYYELALVHFGKEEYKAATIEAKNALQQEPKHLPSRILLGKAYLAAGFPLQAEASLLFAQRLGADHSLIDLPLAESYVQLRKYQELLASIDPRRHGRMDAARINVLRGNAYLALGDDSQAEASFEEALRLDDQVEGAVTGQAKVHMVRGELEPARELLERAVAVYPEQAEAWLLKGKVSYAEGHPEEGLESLTKALELDPDYSEARVFRVVQLIELGRMDLAQEDLDLLYAQPVVEPMAAYLQALVYYRTGQREKAEEALIVASESLARFTPEMLDRNPQMKLLSGTVAFLQSNFEMAVNQLQSYLKQDSGHSQARQMMVRIMLEKGQPQEALMMLQPLLDSQPNTLMTQKLLGEIYLAKQNYAAAARVFGQLALQRREDPDLQLRLAQSLIGDKEITGAIVALENSQRLGGGGIGASIILASLNLERGNLSGATAVARSVLEKDPDNLQAINILGLAQLAAGDSAGARASFQRAVQLDPDYLPARLNLGRVDIAEGASQKARKTYLAMLDRSPNQRETLIAIAELEESQGNLVQAIRWREKLRDFLPDERDSNLKLIDDYLKNKQPTEAVEVALALRSNYPEDYPVRLAMGISQIAAGQPEKAKLTLRNLASWVSYDVKKLRQIAGYQKQLGDLKSAYWSLLKAVDGDPDWLAAKVDLTLLEIQMNKLEDALGRARKLQIEHPEQEEGFFLEGEVLLRERDMEGAEQAYLRSQAIKPGSTTVIRLYQINQSTSRPDEGLRLLETWVEEHPENVQMYELLAGELIRRGRHGEARKIYEEMLGQRPDDSSLLNNLAMLYQMAGDPRAMETVEKAYRLAPDDPFIADTLGWVLVSNGRPEEGLRYLREAQSRKASLPDIGYHLALALHALGRDGEAQRELERVVRGGRDFPDRAAAEALLRKLSGEG